MPMVVGAVAGAMVSSAVGGWVAGTVIGAGLIATGIGAVAGGLVTGVITSALTPSPSMPDANSAFAQAERGALVNTSSTVDSIPVLYGSRRVGGSRIFTEAAGDDNEFLHLVIALCEGEIGAINTVYLDDVASSDTRFTGLVTIEKYVGTDTQAASSALIAALPSSWTSAHQGKGVAYLYVKLEWSQDAFPTGLPTITADVDGKLVYDMRTAATGHSNNPALCVYDYLTNSRYGRGIASSVIDAQSFVAAANHCDALVAIPGAATQKRYTCDGLVNPDNGWLENLKSLLTSCRGSLVFSGGQYKLVLDKAETAIAGFEFTEDNIVGSWSIANAGKRDKFNRVKAKFFNPDRQWQPDFAIYEDASHQTSDNGLVLEYELSLPYTADLYTAQQICQIEEKRSRYGITAQFRATLAGMQCEVMDVVNITHSTPGWSSKPFRVMSVELLQSDEVMVGVREYQDTVYDLDSLTAAAAIPATNLPNPANVGTPGAPGISETKYQTIGSGGVKARATVSWSAPADIFVRDYELNYKLAASSTWTVLPVLASTTVNIDDIAPGTYDFRVRAVNLLAVRGSFSTTTTKEIVGLTDAPSDITGFSLQVLNGLAQLVWNQLNEATDLDVKVGGYIRIRHSTLTSGASWNNAVDIGAAVPGNVTQTTLALLSGTYMAKAVDSSGNASANAVSISTNAPDIQAMNVVTTATEHSAWTGFKSNVTYDGTLGGLKLDSASTIDGMAGSIDDWPFIDSIGGVTGTGLYIGTNIIDLGGKYTARLTAAIKASAYDINDLIDSRLNNIDDWTDFDGDTVDDANVQLFVRSMDVDPALSPQEWGAWMPFYIGDYAARAFEFKVEFATSDTSHNVLLTEMTITCDMPDRVEADEDVASGAGAYAVTFVTPFKAVPALGITAQDMATGDYYTISGKTVSGFSITFKNAAGAAQNRTFDWLAKGYGAITA